MKRLILSTIFLTSGALAADPAEVLKQADRDFAAPQVTLLKGHHPHATPDVPDGSWKFIFDGGVPPP